MRAYVGVWAIGLRAPRRRFSLEGAVVQFLTSYIRETWAQQMPWSEKPRQSFIVSNGVYSITIPYQLLNPQVQGLRGGLNNWYYYSLPTLQPQIPAPGSPDPCTASTVSEPRGCLRMLLALGQWSVGLAGIFHSSVFGFRASYGLGPNSSVVAQGILKFSLYCVGSFSMFVWDCRILGFVFGFHPWH